MKSVVIVVPIYKTKLSVLEEISLKQLFNVLDKYPICFVAPERLNITDGSMYGKSYLVEKFDDVYFENIDGYNKLCLSVSFYERFLDYDFMLIYQLDAFVFSDIIGYFCSLNYDYIGALWPYGLFRYVGCANAIWYVGNGGFSLRKIRSFINLLSTHEKSVKLHNDNEDIFFSSMDGKDFIVAPYDIALKFSFETYVRDCFEMNNRELPFGCHAWEKYDILFWKEYIEKYGFIIEDEYIEKGNMDEVYRDLGMPNRLIACGYFWKKVANKQLLKDYIKKYYDSKSDNFAIWGAGHYGSTLYRIMEDLDFKVIYIIDQRYKEIRFVADNVSVISPEEFINNWAGVNVLIAIDSNQIVNDIEIMLNNCGYKYMHNYIKLEDLWLLKAFIL